MRTIANLALLAALASTGARASVEITLDNPNQAGGPGETLKFFGIITNTSLDKDPADAIYLNADSLDFSLSDATVEDNFFASYFPVFLTGGQSSGDIDLFDIVLANPETQPFGLYAGTYGLIGGEDGGSQTAQDNLAQVGFSVNTQPTVPTPEPGSFGLLGSALILFGCLRLMRKRSRQSTPHFASGIAPLEIYLEGDLGCQPGFAHPLLAGSRQSIAENQGEEPYSTARCLSRAIERYHEIVAPDPKKSQEN